MIRDEIKIPTLESQAVSQLLGVGRQRNTLHEGDRAQSLISTLCPRVSFSEIDDLECIRGREKAYPVLSETETWVGAIIDVQISFVNAQLGT